MIGRMELGAFGSLSAARSVLFQVAFQVGWDFMGYHGIFWASMERGRNHASLSILFSNGRLR
jgi:hypothetical protein